ncbi:MAG: menaquinone-dependent protoporphyrinogen IX dehydrogenase [Alphaproteobacteria bacterium]|nr:menaquinone-dependent protoporphyrinogen IX dehydrogenase [Alphaproteobacteria bacterium]
MDDIKPMAIVFASHDGQTRLIMARLAWQIEALGQPVQLYDLGAQSPSRAVLEESSFIVLAAPVRYGFHLAPLSRFLRRQGEWLRQRHLAVISVNLTARKKGKHTPKTNPYLRRFVRRHRLNPVAQAVFAGRLAYPLYKWWERLALRFIMMISGGPTDPDAMHDYTDWQAVDRFAHHLIDVRTLLMVRENLKLDFSMNKEQI